ncbi:MAG: ester cyclase [Hyphomonadaceae bacterium]
MTSLDDTRLATVAEHMASEVRRDFDATMATFAHPRYELYGAGQSFDGEAAVRGYFAASRRAFPDQANEPIRIRAMDDAVLAEFWLTGTHLGPIKTPQGELAPTGKKVRVRMAAVFEFAPGEAGIICERVYYDSAEVRRQLTN